MPSDIERHRKTKQHLETSITTVLGNSHKGVALLERSKASNQGSKRKTLNPVSDEPCSKRSLLETNNSIVEKQTTSRSTLVNQISPDYQGSQRNLDHFTSVYENNRKR